MTAFVVGIDLGTTNSAVAYARVDALDASEPARIERLAIEQVVAAGEIAARPSLPSFLLLPTAHEVAAEAMSLPWRERPDYTVGALARDRGAELPQRLVASAKSWLSHTGVDRHADILPWRGPAERDSDADKAARVSPVEASARYLAHIAEAWNHAMCAPLSAQEVLLTVPASFDAVARELTVIAARRAGLDNVTLLEEPQAAFYAYLDARGDDWRRDLAPGDVVLVCDIGGGTTDFSLIAVTDDGAGNLSLERVAVGDHILLGGDNMDLAVAHAVTQRLGDKAKTLGAMQQRGLVHACRRAKETLLGDAPPDRVPVSILARGSKLIGGTIRAEVTRDDVETLMTSGFFPEVPASERPHARRAVGLRELGLPYAADPAVTRHLAAFLSRHQARPTALLYNGGVMNGALLRQRVATIVGGWLDGPPKVLDAADLETAVARGAAYYGLVRRGRGVRIRGGTARSYYIGVESATPAIPGFAAPLKGMCVAPAGLEEGAHVDLPDEALGLVVGETAAFRLFASSARKEDQPGDVVDPEEPGQLVELDPVEIALPPGEGRAAGDLVPVTLSAQVTEIGTLALWCVARDGAGRWKLEYAVREGERDA